MLLGMRDYGSEIAELFAEAQDLGDRYADAEFAIERGLSRSVARARTGPLRRRAVESAALLWLASEG
jgi:hypothetical protein